MPLEEFPESSFSRGREVRAAHGIGTLPVVGCVGRIKLVRKGQENLIRAADRVKKRGLRAIVVEGVNGLAALHLGETARAAQ